MPAWLLSILVNYALPIALKFGLGFLLTKWPGMPESIKSALEDLLEKLSDHKEAAAEIKAKGIAKIKRCSGIGCPPSTK